MLKIHQLVSPGNSKKSCHQKCKYFDFQSFNANSMIINVPDCVKAASAVLEIL
jgi:hypothetical protein